MTSTKPARGMRDFLPTDVRKREYVIAIIKEVYESYGFEPLETPAIENIETLLGKYGEEGNQLVFKILKRGDKLKASEGEAGLADLALRYDLTVPLARVVANNRNELPKFFKRYQIQPVWRADRPARGRFREFYQCDVDAIGSSSIVVEAEQILAVSQILKRLGFDDFSVRINDRQVLTDLLDTAGVPEELHTQALVAIDKFDKIGADGVLSELLERGISDTASTMLMEIVKRTQELLVAEGDVSREIVSNLLNIVGQETLERLGRLLQLTAGSPVVIDPSLVRGLSYYTGTIMEITVPDLAGSLGGGGRYDGLIGMFGKEQIPACGFSLGLERILVVMDDRGMFPEDIAQASAADVLVTQFSDETVSISLQLAREIRAAGFRATVYPEPDKLGKQLKYADTTGAAWVMVIGESEAAEGNVTVKNMTTGDQQTVKLADASGAISRK